MRWLRADFAARQCRVLARMPGRRADGVFRLGLTAAVDRELH